MSSPPPLIPVIVGPTAGGKTALAVEVALEFERRGAGRGEVISADAFQVYRGMDIGTGKATPQERRAVAHHLIDILEPDDPAPFTVAQWLGLAEAAVAQIRARGGVPIVAGGTHLYVKSFLEGMFEGPGADEALREELRSMGLPALRAELERVDPAAALRIHPNDERRTIRALEVHRLTGVPISAHQSQWDRAARPDALLVGIEWDTQEINRRINARVRAMVERGLEAEARGLLERGRLGVQAREGLGYKQLAAWLEAGAAPGALADAIEQIKIETRRFAKSQRTWLRRLRRFPHALWIAGGGGKPCDVSQIIVSKCLAPM